MKKNDDCIRDDDARAGGSSWPVRRARRRRRPSALREGTARLRLALLLIPLFVIAMVAATEGEARAQACCVGASGLTPAWLANHERVLVGAQLRLSQTHGTYPARGEFYAPIPGRDGRIETSLFASYRFLPRLQASAYLPLVTTRRRAGDVVETRSGIGDLTLVGRYDLLRVGESRFPGVALLGGFQFPTGTPSDRATPLLAADVTGTGTWEANAGVSVEHAIRHVVLHATVLVGARAPRKVLDLDQQLGLRALYLVGVGYVFDNDVALVGTLSHSSEGDATIAGAEAPGTGFRATQAAFLVVAPLSDTVRLRTSAFTDIPPLGENRPALGGTSISILKSWY